MDDEQRPASDLALTVVPQVGGLVETGDRVEPFRLLDPAGVRVEAVSEFFRELQAAGRSPATLRSYGMDLLRWFRFCWAIDVAWDRATRVDAREFSRWLQAAGKPVRPTGVGRWSRRRLSAYGHAWEIAHKPGFPLAEGGSITVPDFSAS